ncbi:hypothetical protein [Rubrivirga marina]|uniref:Uncharacterized protein n=1 Tax=Rubrivirga marina TaxID=1196024 RepID=A0A271J0F0_9BACT|nr:hypothetical protein [Rubrivirga marina]PAP76435.1 hypothetical protein BSZ37_08270 [Rubrivirga marina]
MRWPARLLWIDCTAAGLAGAAMLALSGWLSALYALPQSFIVGLAVVNLLYGAFSFSLARRHRRPAGLVVLLALANLAWGVACWGFAVALAGVASPFGLAHLVGEGLFVGGMGALEWRWREQLRTA